MTKMFYVNAVQNSFPYDQFVEALDAKSALDVWKQRGLGTASDPYEEVFIAVYEVPALRGETRSLDWRVDSLKPIFEHVWLECDEEDEMEEEVA